MKRVAAVFALILVFVVGALLWSKSRQTHAVTTQEKPAGEEEEKKSRVSHDEKGNVVITMDDETQGNMGLLVAKVAPALLSPEVKGYGRVLDPTPLSVLVTELASGGAAYRVSSNELARLKTLAGQANASARAVQTAEAAALRDQLAIESARLRLALTWGAGIATQTNLQDFVASLSSQGTALVRIDLPGGEVLRSPPRGARISTLTGDSVEAQFLSAATSADPQTLGQGYLFVVHPNSLRLRPGEAVTGNLRVGEEPLAAALIPNDAVVRAAGGGWVYVFDKGGEAFTRTKIALDHPADNGWLITNGVSTNDYVVVTGAQILLSEELKASLKAD